MKPLSYNRFAENNFKRSTSKVSTSKHVAFLWFWLNAFVFCTKSLQVQNFFLPVAALIHKEYEFLLVNSYYLTSIPLLPKLSTPSRIKMMLPVLVILFGFSNYGLMPCWRIKWHTVLEIRCQSSLTLVVFSCPAYHILPLTTHILRSYFIS